MNAFNRLVMLIIALLLLVVPVALLLVGLGIVSAQLADSYTGYQSAASAVGSFSLSGVSNDVRTIAGIASALVALIALILIFREIRPRRRPARQIILNREPGKETKITAKGVRSLAAGAVREAGGFCSNVSLSSRKKAYKVGCGITIPGSGNYVGVAERARDRVRQVLDDQGVPVSEIEITVEGAEPGSRAGNAS